ncbi:MAG: rhodanese-like domain-containing protein [Blastocatellia bacterium]
MILKLGRSALIVAMASLALACAKSGAGANHANAAAPNAVTANNAAPAPSPAQTPEDKTPRIKVEEAKKLVAEGKAVIIDVRGTDSYKMSHIKGSLDVPMNKLETGDFKGLPKDKRIIAYCSCGAGQTSARAALLLQQAGFKDASALLGGTSAWESSGGPMEKASTPTAKKS